MICKGLQILSSAKEITFREAVWETGIEIQRVYLENNWSIRA